MEQLDADVMIGPLSGDESIAIANYAKQHPDKTFVDGSAGAQDTTLKVQAPNFFRFNGDGAQWNAGLGDIAYNTAGLEEGRGRGRRLQLRLDVGGRLHRGVLRGGRPGHQADLPAAEHDRLLVLRPADAHRRRRHVRRGRRRGPHPVPEGLRAGQGADRRQEVHGQPVLGHAGASSSSSARASLAPTSAARARPATWTRPAAQDYANEHHRQVVHLVQAGRATPRRRRRARSPTATTSTRGASSRASRRSRATSPTSPSCRRRWRRSSCRLRTARQARRQPPGGPDGLRPAAVHEGRQAGGQDGEGDPRRRPDVRRHVQPGRRRLRAATSPALREARACRGSARASPSRSSAAEALT